jgi:hypothetical protein
MVHGLLRLSLCPGLGFARLDTWYWVFEKEQRLTSDQMYFAASDQSFVNGANRSPLKKEERKQRSA